MAHTYGRVDGRKCLAILGLSAALLYQGSAFAAQSDILIDQIGQRPAWSSPIVGQIVSPTAGNAFVSQAQPQQQAIDAAFQANSGGLSFAQAASADQLSQNLSSSGAPVEMAFLGYGLDLGRYLRSGTGSYEATDAQGNSLQQDWRGEGNIQFASQEGSNNRAVQQQYGVGNVSVLLQRGTGNVGEILQSSTQGVATLLQSGDRNSATIVQGTAANFASVSQSGIANIVAIRQ